MEIKIETMLTNESRMKAPNEVCFLVDDYFDAPFEIY